MSFSIQRATSDGTLQEIMLSLVFISRSDISVTVGDVLQVEGVDYAWETDSLISFTVPVPNGLEVVLRRSTDLAQLLNIFSLGAVFNNATMDENFEQLLFVAQEAKEGGTLTDLFNDLDMHGNTLLNLSPAVLPSSPVTLEQLNAYAADSAAALRADLQDQTNPVKGAHLVGYAGGTVATRLASLGNELSEVEEQVQEAAAYPLVLTSYATPGTAASQTNALQQALDTGASVVDGGGMLYRIDTTIFLQPHQTLQNCILDFRNAAVGATAIRVLGSVSAAYPIGSAPAGTVNLTFTNTANAANFTAGDYLRFRANNVFDASNTSSKVGEINVVGAVNVGAGTISCKVRRQDSYTASPTVEKINFHVGGRLSNVTVLGRVAQENNQIAVRADWASSFVVTGCVFLNFDSRAVYFLDCINSHVRDSGFYRARPTSSGYGVSYADATQDCTAIGNYFEDVRHSLSTNNTSDRGGVVKRITFSNNSVFISAAALGGSMAGGDAIDTHGAARDITITGNTVYGSTGQGINVECCGATITDNTIVNALSNGITVHNEADFPGSFVISNNRVRNCAGTGVYVAGGFRGTSNVDDGLVVVGNHITSPGVHGIQLGSSSGTTLRPCLVTGNVVHTPGQHGILAQQVRELVIADNVVRGAGVTSNGIRLSDVLTYNVNGNLVRASSAATGDCILVLASASGATSGGVVSGNVCASLSGTVTAWGINLASLVTYTGVWNNTLRATGGISLGTGTGNVQANNIL